MGERQLLQGRSFHHAEGQAPVKNGAAGMVFCRDLAAVRLNDGMGNAQPLAHALLLRGKERLE